jgi:hypothetical protein
MKNETAIDVLKNPLFWKIMGIFTIIIVLLIAFGR